MILHTNQLPALRDVAQAALRVSEIGDVWQVEVRDGELHAMVVVPEPTTAEQVIAVSRRIPEPDPVR